MKQRFHLIYFPREDVDMLALCYENEFLLKVVNEGCAVIIEYDFN